MNMKVLGLCLLGLVAPVAQASIQLDNLSCSGALSINEQNDLSFGCAGDLSLSGGSVSVADGKLFINAGGSLSLSDIFLSALSVNLSASSIYIGDDVSFNDNVIINSDGGPILVSGADATLSDAEITTSSVTISEGSSIDLTASISGDRISPAELSLISPPRIEGGNVALQPYSGSLLVQGLPLSVPIPGALLNWLGGFILCLTASLRRYRIGRSQQFHQLA